MSEVFFKHKDSTEEWQKLDIKSSYREALGLGIANYESDIYGRMRRTELNFDILVPGGDLIRLITLTQRSARLTKKYIRRELIIRRRVMSKFQQRKGKYGKD